MSRKLLLACGIVSSLLYAGMTAAVAAQWREYSSASQTISELSAIGAPTRWLWAVPAAAYTILVTAFGWGVWQSVAANRGLRVAGALIVGFGALGLLWPFAPMHQREVLAAGGGTWTDTLHLALAAASVGVMLMAMAFGADAFGPRFRFYSIISLTMLTFFGVLTFLESPGIAGGRPTPWIGVWERINIGVFLLWVTVLAVALLRSPARPASSNRLAARAA